jgi:HSP20 family protein
MSLESLVPRTWMRDVPARRRGDLFDELWRGFDFTPMAPAVGGTAFVPKIDVVETDEEYRVTAELPGLDEKDFDVVIEDGVLTLKGEKVETRTSEEGETRRRETRSGSFERRFHFAAPIAQDDVKANYRNGVLTVTLPKPPEARPQVRSIPVEAN